MTICTHAKKNGKQRQPNTNIKTILKKRRKKNRYILDTLYVRQFMHALIQQLIQRRRRRKKSFSIFVFSLLKYHNLNRRK